MELGLSLEQAYALTWGEFQMRAHGYKRVQENDWRKHRKVAFYSMIGSHLDHKKLPRNEIKFLPIGDEVVVQPVSEEHKQKYLEAFARYKAKAQNLN